MCCLLILKRWRVAQQTHKAAQDRKYRCRLLKKMCCKGCGIILKADQPTASRLVIMGVIQSCTLLWRNISNHQVLRCTTDGRQPSIPGLADLVWAAARAAEASWCISTPREKKTKLQHYRCKCLRFTNLHLVTFKTGYTELANVLSGWLIRRIETAKIKKK